MKADLLRNTRSKQDSPVKTGTPITLFVAENKHSKGQHINLQQTKSADIIQSCSNQTIQSKKIPKPIHETTHHSN
jgi:hypothetical protein